MTRLLFPQDQTTFVYTGPNQPILMAPRTIIEVFADPAGQVPADLRTADTRLPIVPARLFTNVDGMLPEFLGPDDMSLTLYARALGATVLYPLQARFTEALEHIKSRVGLTSGKRPPSANDGVEGSFWIDTATNKLWGPKVDDSSWPLNPITLATDVPSFSFRHEITAPVLQAVIDHQLSFAPSVTVLDSDGRETPCDVRHVLDEGRVILDFGAPMTATVIFS